MTASWAPTSTVSSSLTVISSSVPLTGDGISVSTLSVETSSSGSSADTSSPTALSHRVTAPSVTLSPRAGMVTGVPSPPPPPSPEPLSAEAGAGAGSSCGAGAGSSCGAGLASSTCWSGVCVVSASSADPVSPPAPLPSPSPPMTASSAPTSTVSSSATRILVSTPAAGDGISVSTLSVETSRRGSSASTCSPSCLSQRVTVPSVTLSPRAGMVTDVGIGRGLLLGSAGGGVFGSAVHVQRLAGQGQVRLAEGLALRRVGVDEAGDVVGLGLPVVDELGLGDELADPAADHVHTDDRAVDGLDELDGAGGLADLAATVATEVVVEIGRAAWREECRF